MFGSAIDYDQVCLINRRWWPLQPRNVVMAPRGNLHFHPKGALFCDDFCDGSLAEQGLFIHEMTHVWQHQTGVNLLLRRYPFARYRYRLRSGKPFLSYGIEQQAEIVRHAFLLKQGLRIDLKDSLADYVGLLPFAPAVPSCASA